MQSASMSDGPLGRQGVAGEIAGRASSRLGPPHAASECVGPGSLRDLSTMGGAAGGQIVTVAASGCASRVQPRTDASPESMLRCSRWNLDIDPDRRGGPPWAARCGTRRDGRRRGSPRTRSVAGSGGPASRASSSGSGGRAQEASLLAPDAGCGRHVTSTRRLRLNPTRSPRGSGRGGQTRSCDHFVHRKTVTSADRLGFALAFSRVRLASRPVASNGAGRPPVHPPVSEKCM